MSYKVLASMEQIKWITPASENIIVRTLVI